MPSRCPGSPRPPSCCPHDTNPHRRCTNPRRRWLRDERPIAAAANGIARGIGGAPAREASFPAPPRLPTKRPAGMKGGRALVLAVPWGWLLLFLLAPAGIVLAIALAQPADGVPPYLPPLHWISGSPHWQGTFDNFSLVTTDPLYRDALLLSLKVAGISTLLCLLAGYPMALALARARRADAQPAAPAADAAVLDRLPDAHQRLDRPAAGRRLDQRCAGVDRRAARCGCSTPTPRCISGSSTPTCRSWSCRFTRGCRGWTRCCWRPRPISAHRRCERSCRITLPLSLPGVWAGGAAGVRACGGGIRHPRTARRAAGAD